MLLICRVCNLEQVNLGKYKYPGACWLLAQFEIIFLSESLTTTLLWDSLCSYSSICRLFKKKSAQQVGGGGGALVGLKRPFACVLCIATGFSELVRFSRRSVMMATPCDPNR